MDGEAPVLVKREVTSDMNHEGVLIVPDVIPPQYDDTRMNGELDMTASIKVEPPETVVSVDGDNDMENPYQCFECGLDCDSQRQLIDHYESTHTEEILLKAEQDGNTRPETDVEDPLAGDEAPDSPDKAADVEGAQDDSPTCEVLLVYSCPCCGHSTSDWNYLAKHMENHVQVTCLPCSKCMHLFSSSYRLKDYTGRGPYDKPHVCPHCSYKTHWCQALKNHCVTHHKEAQSLKNNNLPPLTPNNVTNRIDNSLFNPRQVQTSLEPKSQISNSTSPPMPFNLSQTGCYVVLQNGTPNGNHLGNVALPVGSLVPVIPTSTVEPYGEVQNVFTPNISPIILPDLQQGALERGAIAKADSLSTTPIIPNLIPKSENSSEFKECPPNVLPPKPTSRTISSKVPVDELLKKWSFTNVSPETPSISLKKAAPKKQKVAFERVVLTGTPFKSPKGSPVKSRKGIRNKPCPHCPHVARDAHSLKTHILTHTKEKPFACELCNYRATQRAHIKKHMKRHWGSEIKRK